MQLGEQSYLYGGCLVSGPNTAARLVLLCRRDFQSSRARCVALFVEGDQSHELELPPDFFVGVASIGEQLVFVGQHGTTLTMSWPEDGSPVVVRTSSIEAVREFGELTTIKTWGGCFYLGGQFGQLYKSEGPGWVRADHGLRSFDGPDFEDIAGGDEAVIGVGLFGEIHRFDGRGWARCDADGECNLSRVEPLADGGFVAVGYDGTVLVGHDQGWSRLWEPIADRNYEDCAIVDDVLFAVHPHGCDRIRLAPFVRMEDPFEGGVTVRRVLAGYGRILIVSETALYEWADESWQEVPV